MKAIRKDLFREIRHSFGRFFAIFAIVLLGVAFFAGVSASPDNMRLTADTYFDEYRLQDLRLISSIGFTEEEVEKIRETEGVDGVSPVYTLDVLGRTEDGETESVVSLTSLPLNTGEENENYLNRLRLYAGRLPETADECVLRVTASKKQPLELGEKLYLRSGTEDALEDSLNVSCLTVVGLVYTPYSISFDLGSSEIGNGNVSYLAWVPETAFESEYYTNVFVTLSDVSALDSFTEEYLSQVEPVAEEIKTLGKESIVGRIADIKTEIREEVTEKVTEEVTEKVTEEVEKILSDKIEEVCEEQEEELLAGSEDWKWYVLDRESQASYVEYRSAAETMEKISVVFPLFFFFVAALVCFTTMSRMVDDERLLIGTYKALGYGKAAIAMKYVRYALYASLSGGILGCFLGMQIFPGVIMNAWGIAYQMPEMLQADHLKLDMISVASMTLIVVLAALLACFRDLVSVPAALMRPKAPKHGKTVFLEKIGFIWKKIDFTGKVTIRNIFRYKKRFFMTLLGVAGCTALLVTGFGISDSVSHLVGTQYGEIYRYDASVTLKEGLSAEEKEETVKELSALSEFEKTLFISAGSAKVNTVAEDPEKEDLQVSLTVLPGDNASDFVLLKDAKTKKMLMLSDEGLILPEMTADRFNLKTGDRLLLENKDGVRAEAVISGIAEFYVGHDVFITENYYEKLFGETAEKNTLLALSPLSEEEVPAFSQKLMDREEISAVSFFNLSVKNIRQMTAALSIITVVLIISSLLLSFVVLYNMTNVNISERIREIATIKVLGFYDREVNAYVYRESIAITVLGALIGLGAGVLLHHYIMGMITMDNVTFGNYIDPKTYVYSFLLTMLFSVIVSLFIMKKLKRVPMVESLKAVE